MSHQGTSDLEKLRHSARIVDSPVIDLVTLEGSVSPEMIPVRVYTTASPRWERFGALDFPIMLDDVNRRTRVSLCTARLKLSGTGTIPPLAALGPRRPRSCPAAVKISAARALGR